MCPKSAFSYSDEARSNNIHNYRNQESEISTNKRKKTGKLQIVLQTDKGQYTHYALFLNLKYGPLQFKSSQGRYRGRWTFTSQFPQLLCSRNLTNVYLCDIKHHKFIHDVLRDVPAKSVPITGHVVTAH